MSKRLVSCPNPRMMKVLPARSNIALPHEPALITAQTDPSLLATAAAPSLCCLVLVCVTAITEGLFLWLFACAAFDSEYHDKRKYRRQTETIISAGLPLVYSTLE
jgi:hypothetical protein